MVDSKDSLPVLRSANDRSSGRHRCRADEGNQSRCLSSWEIATAGQVSFQNAGAQRGPVAISRSPDMALKGHPLGLRFSGVSRLHIRREFYIERHGQSFQRILSSFYGTRFSLENSSSGCDAQIPFS